MRFAINGNMCNFAPKFRNNEEECPFGFGFTLVA